MSESLASALRDGRARPSPGAPPDDPLRRLFRAAHTNTKEELAEGQIVIVAARWILVGAGLVLALWNPASIGPLRLQVLVLLLIAVGNFFLHAQLLKRRGTVDGIAYGASAADLAVITLLVASQGAYDSNLFAFYFPAVLALSVAFNPAFTAIYTGTAMALYGLICLESLGLTITSGAVQTVAIRLIMIAAVGFCGALYQQVEATRRGMGDEG